MKAVWLLMACFAAVSVAASDIPRSSPDDAIIRIHSLMRDHPAQPGLLPSLGKFDVSSTTLRTAKRKPAPEKSRIVSRMPVKTPDSKMDSQMPIKEPDKKTEFKLLIKEADLESVTR